MRGNVEPRGDGRWRLRVFVGRENGRTKHVTRSFRGTKRQAETELAKFVADVDRNQVAVGHSGSLQDLLVRWLAAVGPGRSAYTMKEYRRLVERNIGPAIGSVRLAKLTGAGSTPSMPISVNGGCPLSRYDAGADHVAANASEVVAAEHMAGSALLVANAGGTANDNGSR
jgi:hypothetical protein